MTQNVKEKLVAECTAGGHALESRRLFILFCAHARINYRYSAVKLKGSEGNTLLGRPKDEIVTVDCAAVADYSNIDEVMSWKLVPGGGQFGNIVRRVTGDPNILLVRVPPNDPSPAPPGFNGGFIHFKSSDLRKDQLSALGGQRENPSWSDSKFESNRDAALVSINKLLKERAGITAAWSFPG